MNHYIEIRLLPDHEVSENHILAKLWSKLHLQLVEAALCVAVSFPDHSQDALGARMRLHGSQESLSALMGARWAKGCYSYMQCSEVLPVPAGASHVAVSRVQYHNNPETLRRRAEKRGNLSQEEIDKLFTAWNAPRPQLPFVILRSASSKRNYPIYVRQQPADAKEGGFNAFGLGLDGTTVPMF
ncbi:type I-F CRISPR-associated endoribonuclease Cas6/Csy4 [Salmonella enterica]|nr:type I-F CRISPR-associated endoribonuclease Cas6/Csy4 [Salmonella enterica]